MTQDAQKIVDALLEGDDEKPKKKMPAWLAKIKGEPVDDEEGDGEKKDGGESSSSSSGGSSGAKGIGTPSSGESVKKTW